MTVDYASQWGLPVSQPVLDDFPFPLSVFRLDGLLVGSNRAAEDFWGVPRSNVIGQLNVLQNRQTMAQGIDQIFTRVGRGERVVNPPRQYKAEPTGFFAYEHGEERWVSTTFFPLRDGTGTISYVMSFVHDMTVEVEQAQAIETTRREVATQRQLIAELASPVVRVWDGILAVPIIGVLDGPRAVAIMDTLLDEIVAHQAETVIIDITGMTIVDALVAGYLLNTARACRLLGSVVALVGIRSDVAQALTGLGVDMSRLVTRSNLQAGIVWAFERHGLVVQPRRQR